MEYVLKTNNLGKKFKDFTAVNSLNMNVPKGSIYGFVGKNGAGKTTLIRMICGLQKPSWGDFELYGIKNTDPSVSKARRRMGAVVETPSIYLDMTAKDNLIQQYSILGIPGHKDVDDLLSLVGLENTGNKKAGNYSLGMRQRLGIAIALCGDPDLLILDEPINGLDPQGIIDIRELILRLNRERNITVVISSHILDELSKLATHYGFIDRGSIVREMSAEDLAFVCRKCIRLTVSDIKALSMVLDEMGMEYKIIDDTCADVYAKPVLSHITRKLDTYGCDLITASEHDESLESFYISLVGGDIHE
jgi:ABC-2 type transport system ATP-binding protein